MSDNPTIEWTEATWSRDTWTLKGGQRGSLR